MFARGSGGTRRAARGKAMSGVLKNRTVGLWHWFAESEVRPFTVLLTGVVMMVFEVPIWAFIVLILMLMFIPRSDSNRLAAKEIAGKPFSFCLPGYRESLRKSTFVTALSSGIGLGLVWYWMNVFDEETSTPMEVVLDLTSAFSVSTAFLLCISVDFRFVLSRLAWNLLMLLSIPLFMIAVGTFVALMAYPALGVPAGLAVCAFVWIRLGDMTCVRRGHRMIVQDALDRQAQTGVTRTASPSVEGLFLRLAKSARGSMTAPHLWGGLYRTFGLILSYWKWLLVSIVGATLVLGYTGESNAFVALGLVALAVRLPIFSGMLLPESRREKPRLAIAVAVVTTVWLMVMASLVVALSWCLVGYMPHAFGTDYAGLDPWNIALPSVLVPWLFVLQLLFAEELNSMSTIAPLIGAVSMTIVALFAPQILTWTGIPRVIVFGVILISGWAFFLPILRRVCTSGDLSGQGPCVVV